MNQFIKCFSALVLCFAIASNLLAQIIYISPGATGNGDRDDPADIEYAFNNLAIDGSHLRLDTGTYVIDNRLLLAHDNMIIEGGFMRANNWAKTSEVGASTIHRTGMNAANSGNQAFIVAIQAGGKSGFRIQDLSVHVEIPDTSTYATSNGYGVTAYGIKTNNCNNYIINRVAVNVEGGSNGHVGATGEIGISGDPGELPHLVFPDVAGGDGGNSTPASVSAPSGGTQGTLSHAETLNANSSAFTDTAIALGDYYQTFKPTTTGYLSKVEAHMEDDGACQFYIYSGASPSGANLLYHEAHSLTNTSTFHWEAFEVSEPILVTSGQTYTIRIGGATEWARDTGNPYADGQASENAGWDFAFRTYIMQKAPNGQDGGTVSGRTGAPGGGGGGRARVIAIGGDGGSGGTNGTGASIPGIGDYPYANYPQDSLDGGDGIDGLNGSNGVGVNLGSITTIYTAGNGFDGDDGIGGNGGAGGGGGVKPSGTQTWSGGGGGGGGQGGAGGQGGLGGGGSFGLFLTNNGANALVQDCHVTVGPGGDGGAGGAGGSGGSGGAGGSTASSPLPAGNGGDGGDGGVGGVGSAGPDGHSMRMYQSGTSLTKADTLAPIATYTVFATEEIRYQNTPYTCQAAGNRTWITSTDTISDRNPFLSFTNSVNDLWVNGTLFSDFVLSTNNFTCPVGNILYVDQSAMGTNDGSSWANAFTEVHHALDVGHSCANITDIYVAEGIYRPSRTADLYNLYGYTFFIHKDLKIYGGFLGGESSPDDRPMVNGKLDKNHYAILNGDLGRNDEYDLDSTHIINIFNVDSTRDNVIHLVDIKDVSNQMLLDGFVITGAHASGSASATIHNHQIGAGLINRGEGQSSDPVFKNLIFRDNVADWRGGAAASLQDAAPTFWNCEFINNKGFYEGGAVFNRSFGGTYNAPVFTKCRFAGNESFTRGGAAFNWNYSGGIGLFTFDQCIFTGNLATSAAAIIGAESSGGTNETVLLNCLFAGNSPSLLSSGGLTRLYNSVIYGNDLDGQPALIPGNYDVQYSNIQGVPATGTNYNFNPFFIDASNESAPHTDGNYMSDPCLLSSDLGSNLLYTTYSSDTLDYDLKPRFVEGSGVSNFADPTIEPIDLGPWETESSILFTATKDSTDAYIDLHWEVEVDECNCFDEDPVLRRGVTIQLKNGNQLIKSWLVYKENVEGTTYIQDFRHNVGPDTSINYTLEFKKTGPGTLNCRQIERGSTLPFRPVELKGINKGNKPSFVRANWINHSTLTNQLNLFRNGALIATVDAGNELDKIHKFEDLFSFTDPKSFVNGSQDTYCIQTISNIYTKVYGTPVPQQTCAVGWSRNINLLATDNAFPGKVVLTWDNMENYADRIRIVRDGELIAVVENTATSFEDVMPVYGKNCLYGVELVEDNVRNAGHYDYGMVLPNGLISGKVLTAQQKVPVNDVKIMLTWMESDSAHVDSTTTNYLGEFQFTDLYYGRSNTFTLTASKNGETFETNPLITQLNLSEPVDSESVFFMEKELEDSSLLNINISFSATPDSMTDMVNLNWLFQKNNAADTVFFNLFRGSDLIDQIVDIQSTTDTIDYMLSDLTGIPNSLYDYTLIAYTANTSELVDTALSDTTYFPPVAPVATLDTSVMNSLGTVDLDWTHTSMNFDGFRVYRIDNSTTQIFEGSHLDFNFTDDGGIPGVNTGYFITAFRTVDAKDFESSPVDTVYVDYPALTPINSLTTTGNALMDLVKLEFTVPAIYVPNYAYEGVRIIRSLSGVEKVLATMDREFLQAGTLVEYNDYSGIPFTLYDYEVRPFVTSLDSIVEISGNIASRTFPRVSIPQDLTFTSQEGKIELKWRSPHTSNNIDGFVIYKGTGPNPDSIGMLPYQYTNRFNHYTNNPPNNNSESYRVATFRYVDGVRYLSLLASIVADPPFVNGDEAIHLANFIATKDQAHHIKLCWDWNDDAIQTPFILRREGVEIATLPFTSRSYYDYDAPKGIDLEYSIETPGIDDSLNFQLVYTIGRSPSMKTVYGRVSKAYTQQGLMNKTIHLELVNSNNSNDIYIDQTQTDFSGFYQFSNLPVPTNADTYVGTLFVDTTNSLFVQNPQTLTITSSDSSDNYQIDFVDLHVDLFTGNNVAEIDSFTATPDPVNMAIHLSWSPTNENFDGFEIYRGTTKLGEVLKGEELIWSDDEGLPGVLTLYAVRAFQAGVTGTEYADFRHRGAVFPILAPVEYLTATTLLEQNSVLVQWSHPYDNHDYYTLTRNGISPKVINTGNPLSVIDSTGIPGKLYNYEVIAWKGTIPSLPRYISAAYPEAEPIRGFDISAPTIVAPLSEQSTDVTTSRNHVLLEWEYADYAADSFMIFRFIRTGNNKSDETTLARVGGQQRSFKDYTGFPNQQYHYEIIAILSREGNEYYSQRLPLTWSENIVYPLLHPPTYLQVQRRASEGVTILRFRNQFEGAEGYKIYRDGIELFDIRDSSFHLDNTIDWIYDKTGIPGHVGYQYSVSTYSTRYDVAGGSSTFESVPALYTINYPLPPTPVDFQASDGLYPNKIELTWSYDKDIPVDNFEIERQLPDDGWTFLAWMEAGERTYTDFITGNNIPPDEHLSINYRIKAINQTIESNTASDAGSLYSGLVFGDNTGPNRKLGTDVDIDGGWAVAGTDGRGFQIFKLSDDNTWELYHTVSKSPGSSGRVIFSDCFGCKVAISGDYIAVSAWKQNVTRGAIYVYKRNNSQWEHMQTIKEVELSSSPDQEWGKALDIYDNMDLGGKDYLVFSSRGAVQTPNIGNNFKYRGRVHVYKRSGDEWQALDVIWPDSAHDAYIGYDVSVYEDRLMLIDLNRDIEYYSIDASGATYITRDGCLECRSLDLDEDWVITGLPNSHDVRFYSVTNGGFTLEHNQVQSNNFGHSVGIKGDYAVGGRESDNQVSLFERSGNSWPVYFEHYADPAFNDSGYGHSVAVSSSHYVLGNPNALGGAGLVDFVPIKIVPPPVDVTATDGTQPAQVLVTWKEPSDVSNIVAYSVFRDGEFLTSVNSSGAPGNILSHVDLPSAGLIPGKHSVYQVEATSGSSTSKSIGDEGWMPPNGLIAGTLKTLQGGAPVENAVVTASLMVDGDYLVYTTTTDNIGAYEIDDIYYGEESVVTVACTYLDHEIISQQSAGADPPSPTIDVTLKVNANTNINSSFFDKTAYAITGSVRHLQIPDCFLDSVKVSRIYSVDQNGTRIRQFEDKYTDKDGNFSFIINPELASLDTILVQADNTKYLTIENGQPQDSICFDFDGESTNDNVKDDHPDGLLYITEFDIDRTTVIDFYDQTLYPVTVNVVNTCGAALLNNPDRWTIRARSVDGCYEKLFRMTGAKTHLVEVPPIDMIFTVSDVSDYSENNLDFLTYLLNNPVQVNLEEFHIQEAKQLSQSEIIERLTIDLEYHRPPSIQPNMSALDFLCDDMTRQAIVTTGEEYTIPISVTEPFSPPCDAKSGYVKVINGASAESTPAILPYNDSLGKFEDYVFTAGAPNPVIPHRWNFKIEYYSDGGVFQGEFSHEIFVIGSINLPGNGILTDASDDTDVVPLPLYVLRDPPGDGSSSSIAEGYSTTVNYSFAKENGGGAGIYASGGLEIFSLGFEGETEITGGEYNSTTKTLSISSTLSNEIKTSESETGRGASIIVGAGVAMQYGIINSYDITCDGDIGRVTETRSIGFTPLEIQTTWTYTVTFIEDLIAGYNSDLIRIEEGSLILKDSNGDPFSQEEAADKISALRDNWIQVLQYFDFETNPVYHITHTDFTDTDLYPTLEYAGLYLNHQANLWRDALVADIGSDPNVTFGQTKLDKYNNAATAIRELMHVSEFHNAPGNIEAQKIIEAYTNWHFTQSRYDNVNYYTSIPGIQLNEMAENLTFSGGTSQTSTYGQSKTFNTAGASKIFFKSSFKLGLTFGGEVEFELAPFGIGVVTQAIKAEQKIGAVGSFEHTTTESTADENNVSSQISYTLADDDPLDEMSVTVIKGITPNHTPLFQTFGGKTSCPHEEGTLEVDNPVIQVLAPSADTKASLFFQDPDEPATFTIQLANLSAPLEDREIEVFLDNASNPHGAIIRVAGVQIGAQKFTTPALAYNVPLLLTLTVERGLSYDYSGLRIGARPSCEEGNIEDYITLDVHFQSPCSPVSIVSPSNNWLINSSRRELIVQLRDYEPMTPNFEGIELQYRKLASGVNAGGPTESGWKTIPPTSIKPTDKVNNPVSPAVLQARNATFGPGVTPNYFMVWEPDMGNSSLFTDGKYEVRARSKCMEGSLITNYVNSNIIRGTIDRSRMQVFGRPQPADGVWVPGDQVSVTFNKNIDCSLLLDPDFCSDSLRVFVANTEVHNATFSCFGNKIQMTLPNMTIYDGQIMRVSVRNITDRNGNYAREVDAFGNSTRNIQWEFLISTSKAYWEQDSIVVQLYEGDSLEIIAGLRNTDFQSSLNGISLDRSTASDAWLLVDPDPAGNFNINPGAVRPVTMTFIGHEVGTYYDTLTVANLPGMGRIPALPIKLVTVKRPPYPPDWEVDGNQYPNSMTVVANYIIDGGAKSNDTLDQITAWIGNTLRGVGRIQLVGDPVDSNYVAYITVYGNSSDDSSRIEFRVWDQSTDTEYNANVAEGEPAIIYGDNLFNGSTFAPRILHVDSNAVRYIYLNQGYTWISFNSVLEDMSVNHVLQNLTNVSAGDRILGQSGFTEYQNAQTGWYADPSVNLDTFSTDQTYMVYLQNGPDSIRMTGSPAPPLSDVMAIGTNWVGFPSQGELLLEDAIQADLSKISQIKNKDLSRVTDSLDTWTSGLLTKMIPNEGYKLIVFGNSVNVTIPDSIVSSGSASGGSTPRLRMPADPNNAATWNIDAGDYYFTDVIPVVGKLIDEGGTVSGDGTRKVAAFINGDLRGVGLVQNIAQLNDSLFTIFIGKDDVDNGMDVKFYYFDGSSVSDSMTMNISLLTSNAHGLFNYSTPLIWNLDACADHLLLTLEDSPLDGFYEARQTITVIGNVLILNGAQVILNAPDVTINGLETNTGGELEVLQVGCD